MTTISPSPLAEHNRKNGKAVPPLHNCSFFHLRTVKIKEGDQQVDYDIFVCSMCLETVRIRVAPDEVVVL